MFQAKTLERGRHGSHVLHTIFARDVSKVSVKPESCSVVMNL